jgi:hypothetical protein
MGSLFSWTDGGKILDAPFYPIGVSLWAREEQKKWSPMKNDH